MADIERRTVRPTHPDAYSPDPDHGGKLVAEGREVVWTPYWQSHLDKGNVVEVEEPADPEPEPAASKAPAPPKAAAQPALAGKAASAP